MIEKMKKVWIITSPSGKEEMLNGLRDIGVMHIAEKEAPDREIAERFQSLSRTETALKEYAGKKSAGKNGKASGKDPADAGSADRTGNEILSEEEFARVYADVRDAMEQKTALTQAISEARSELERISPWGDFSPAEVNELRKAGFDLHFYRMGEKEYKAAAESEDIKLIRLASVGKMKTAAVLGTLPPTIQATEFILPEKGTEELERDIGSSMEGIARCDETLRAASAYDASFKAEILKTQDEENFSSAELTAKDEDGFVWLSGYIPEEDLEKFRKMAAEKGCAWACDDVAEDDDQIPTKVKYNKVSRLIKPVFDILGILPGYREQDISLWFFLFFILFFAMIIGDGGYGVLILIGTVALNLKQKKVTNVTFLLYVLSIATVVWGAITGTWFGIESAMEVPLLKALVIPSFATYPEYFGLEASDAQNTIMKFSFTIGAVQMALGSILSIKKKIPEKNLSWVADAGWTIAVIAMYLLSLILVIHESINIVPVFIAIGVAFLLVVLFGGMSPEKTFGQGLKSGLADSFTVFLNTISCFGNVMSYIRLFAVGMAGVAISQSFNGIAAGMHGPLMILGVVVVLIGHALNLIMCFLSVVVHGVRLNVLEFSGQVGLEWTGIPYEPFKKLNDKKQNE